MEITNNVCARCILQAYYDYRDMEISLESEKSDNFFLAQQKHDVKDLHDFVELYFKYDIPINEAKQVYTIHDLLEVIANCLPQELELESKTNLMFKLRTFYMVTLKIERDSVSRQINESNQLLNKVQTQMDRLQRCIAQLYRANNKKV